MANIRDVAQAAGVSIASVSAVLNGTGRVGETTRERIRAAISAVGYAPNAVARSLRTGHSHLIGAVVGDITNPFSAALVRIVEKAAIARGYSVLICNVDGDESRVPAIIDQLRGQHVAGILLTPMGRRAALFARIRASSQPPIVTFDQKLPGLERDFVGLDNRAAIRMLVTHLARLGHERIALISGLVGRWTADERHAGFLEGMTEADLPIDPSLIARAPYQGDSAYAATTAMLTRRDRPTAIVAASNVTALGALRSSVDLGFRCPDDISIAGMDDVPWSGLVRPKLSIASQPIGEMGALAMEWLLERIEHPERHIPPREMIFHPSFSAGESCAGVQRNPARAITDILRSIP